MSEDAASMTDEYIASIADRMIDEGRRVSPVTVWSELNSGSIVEIAAALQRWQAAKQPPASQVQPAAEVPEEIAGTLMDVARRLWAASREDAERVLNQRVHALSDQLASILAERDEALGEYQKTHEQAANDRRDLALATERVRASEDSVHALESALAAASARGEAAEARAAELLQRVVSAEDGLQAARASLEEQGRTHEGLIAEISNRNDEMARVSEQRDGLQQELAALGAAYQAKSDELERWSREARAATSRAEAAEAATAAQVSDGLARIRALESELDGARSALDAERATNAAHIDELGRLTQAHEALSAVAASRNDELAAALRERDEARQDIATLDAACQAKSEEVERWAHEARAATSRAEAAEAAAAQASEGLAKVSELESQLEAARGALEAERVANAAHIDEAATRRNEFERLAQAHDELGAVIASKNDELTRAIHERDEARQEIATLDAACRAKSEEVERWTREASAAASGAQAAEAAAAQAGERLAEHAVRETERESAHRAMAAELQASRDALAEERKSTASRLEEASVRIEELERVTRELGQAREQIAALSGHDAAAGAELRAVAQEVAAARERADAAELHAAELEHRLAKQEHADAALKSVPGREIEIRAAGGASADEVIALQRQVTAQARAHEKAYGDLRTKAEQWVSYAKDLKQRLDQANEENLIINARSVGEVALMRKLSFELERLKPDHELVFREAQQSLIGEKMAQQLAQKGYRYDPATAVISKMK